MSEPAAKPRYLGDIRNAFDLEEIERRMRESIEQPRPAPEADPLAELARLVGQTNNDAFSKIFETQGGPTAPPPARGAVRPLDPPPVDYQHGHLYAVENEAQHADPHAYTQDQAYAADPHYQYEHAQGEQAYAYERAGEQGDAYAQQAAAWHDQNYQHDGYYDEAQQDRPRNVWRARLLIGAAALVVAAGGAGAYMLRGHAGVGGEAPTIMANAGPTKVQPAQPASDGPKPSISILERGGPTANQQSKVIQTEEQPVDVAATARISGSRPARTADAGAPVTLAPPAPPPVANSIFAEPKRVKAIAVRPDGTVIEQTTPSQRAEAATPSPATPALPTVAARPTDMASLVAATTPSTTPGSGQRSAARSTETKPPVADPKPAAATPKPPAKVVAAATPATTASIPGPTGAGGAFSVQLAGTTSVEEAKDAVERLSRRFGSELGGYKPAVVKAEVGSKVVYRVRVKNLSSEDANTLCARLKSGGGSCFVARN